MGVLLSVGRVVGEVQCHVRAFSGRLLFLEIVPGGGVRGNLCRPGLYLVGVAAIPVAGEPVEILDTENNPPVTLDLLQVFHFMPDQALVILIPRQDISHAPEARPPMKTA